ncbi:MAG: ABC transporter ATP-binding protein [Lentisphaerae bacterium]|jgi:oligopeptide/dipeptide ABC transporter ATP-binding protein|nr:ABC transporter ATP-binding protein [Lentisphaerota bacterium]MBT4816820.1 ABC transporter ATP-binding protein [Lentisphaerota bacterium]MBT5609491.1 ABC transporter ATP-binding protein [Lentisphaerota bacterium]MBT7057698.1 ABC transporter ATP-binding protein [Lentisphaerota bacterium]MBT7848647.1 ABC transporter ATP-binding protein [Lentisphaerota bacterium]
MQPLLQVQDLRVTFNTEEGRLTAADSVSFDIHPGEVLGMVGESGCGKSVTALSILRLIPSPPGQIANGRILLQGTDLLELPVRELRDVRGDKISMIFQEPMTALSPLHRVGKQLVEAQQLHRDVDRKQAWQIGEEWLHKVGIPEAGERMFAYPFELSGGMRQRVMIAMALMLEPQLIIADEPTTALDVTIQAQILDLMLEMKKDDTSVLLITHDMGVVWDVCDRVVVMYASRIVEEGPVKDVFNTPFHPYTQGLLKSMPVLAKDGERLPSIEGQVPSLLHLPSGCNFAGRCPHATDRCHQEEPPLSSVADGRKAACFYAERWLSTTVNQPA